MVQRWDFYQCLVKTWQHLCAEYHDASKVLAGDANLPGLRFSSRGHIEASNALEEFWCQTFLSNMVCANAFHDCPAPTHTGGNVLDIVLCSSDLEILACDVLSTQLAGSDHFPVLLEVGWQPPGGQNALTWKPFRDVPQQVFDHALQQPFAVLYTWLASALQHKQLHSDLIDLLEDATVLFGVLILGTLAATFSFWQIWQSIQPLQFQSLVGSRLSIGSFEGPWKPWNFNASADEGTPRTCHCKGQMLTLDQVCGNLWEKMLPCHHATPWDAQICQRQCAPQTAPVFDGQSWWRIFATTLGKKGLGEIPTTTS